MSIEDFYHKKIFLLIYFFIFLFVYIALFDRANFKDFCKIFMHFIVMLFSIHCYHYY